MKRISVFAGTVGALALSTAASADMTGLSYDMVEMTGDGAIAGAYCVRVYAEMGANDRLDAVAGNSDQSLVISYLDGASGYQNTTYGGPTSTSINDAFFALAPSLEWDSYVTIGSLYANGYPFANNALNEIGIDWTSFEGGGDLFTDNGTWFVTPDQPQGEAQDGRVLVAQLTTYSGSGAYDIMFEALFQGKDGTGDTWSGSHSVMIAVPAPGAVALLGLAGLAGRRRRRA